MGVFSSLGAGDVQAQKFSSSARAGQGGQGSGQTPLAACVPTSSGESGRGLVLKPPQGPVVPTSFLFTQFILRTKRNRVLFHLLLPPGDEFIGREMGARRGEEAGTIDRPSVICRLRCEDTAAGDRKGAQDPKAKPHAFSQAARPSVGEEASALRHAQKPSLWEIPSKVIIFGDALHRSHRQSEGSTQGGPDPMRS